MKKTVLYSIVVLVVLVIVVVGWYAFTSEAATFYGSKCRRWICTDTVTYTCPADSIYTNCYSGTLRCYNSYTNTTYSCSNWHVPSCSGNTLVCTLDNTFCAVDKPGTNCVSSGRCTYCKL